MLRLMLFRATANSDHDPITSSKVVCFEESQVLLFLSCGSIKIRFGETEIVRDLQCVLNVHKMRPCFGPVLPGMCCHVGANLAFLLICWSAGFIILVERLSVIVLLAPKNSSR